MRYCPVIAAILLVTGCSRAPVSDVGKYQIAAAPSGQVYRLDTSSGDVTVIQASTINKSGGDRPKLVVGTFYETETGEVLRYVGKGKFEPRRPLSDYERK